MHVLADGQREATAIAGLHPVCPNPFGARAMQYLIDLWHDMRDAWGHFRYVRNHLRQGGNPDEAF